MFRWKNHRNSSYFDFKSLLAGSIRYLRTMWCQGHWQRCWRCTGITWWYLSQGYLTQRGNQTCTHYFKTGISHASVKTRTEYVYSPSHVTYVRISFQCSGQFQTFFGNFGSENYVHQPICFYHNSISGQNYSDILWLSYRGGSTL